MSELDYVEPSSDSFWEIGQYKRTVKRAEDGHKLCYDLVQMISERADLEKAYSKSLKTWSKKWMDYLQKGSEYGSMRQTWQASLTEADKLADIHLQTHNVLNDELNREIKDWQKQNYQKTIVNQLKITKEYDEEFKKAQKPWSKKYLLVEKTKKEYHSTCKSLKSAAIQSSNSESDATLSNEQKKKLKDKVEKYKKEVEINKQKYLQALDDLNSYNSRYIEDMNNVYKKCDQFEKERLEFFIQKFIKLQSHLNIFEKMNVEDIYNEFMRSIKQTSPEKDLVTWSKEFGSGMPMNWPVFEEYSEELKQINKKKLANSDQNNGGITITSIKHKTDEFNDPDSRSISLSEQNNQRISSRSILAEDPWADTPSYNSQRSNEFANSFEDYNNNSSNSNWTMDRTSVSNPHSNNSRESNPFGEYEDEDEATNKHGLPNGNNNNNNTNGNINDDSDDEAQKTSYLNIKVKALYDYHSVEDDELSFKAGDEFIKLATEDERGWCLGKIGGKVGLYPATYASEV